METVKVYSTPTCPYCHKAKEFLKQHKIPYHDINVAEDDKARAALVKKSGQMGVPVIEVGKELIIGFDEEELTKKLFGVRGKRA